MRSTLSRSVASPSTSRSWPCVRILTLNSDSRCLRFSSYEPNSVSMPASGTAMLRFIRRRRQPFLRSRLLSRYHATTYRRIIAPLRDDFQVEFVELLPVDRRGRVGHQIERVGGLRERNHLADRRLAAQDRDDAVE